MNALTEFSYLDALLLMCLEFRKAAADPDTTSQELIDARKCIYDCEQRQMALDGKE
jgi:hypothetical protein